MLQLKDFMPVNFLKKEKYTGSCKAKENENAITKYIYR